MDTNEMSQSHRTPTSKEQRRRTVGFGYGMSLRPQAESPTSTTPPPERSVRDSSVRPVETYGQASFQRSYTSGPSRDQMLPRRRREELLQERRQSWQQAPPYQQRYRQSPPEVQATTPVQAEPQVQQNNASRSRPTKTEDRSSYALLTKLLAVADRNEALMKTLLTRMDDMDTRMESLARKVG